jgi:hypothetical protein
VTAKPWRTSARAAAEAADAAAGDEYGKLLAQVAPGMLKAQARILAPLPKAERAEFMRMLRVLVDANNDLSRAPSSAA